MTYRLSKKSFKHILSFSYIIVLIVPLLIITLINLYICASIKNSNETTSKLMAEKLSEQVENVLQDSSELFDSLLVNHNIQRLSKTLDMSNGRSAFARQKLIEELKNSRLSSNLFSEILIYFPATDYCVTSRTTFPADLSSYIPSVPLKYEDLNVLKNTSESKITCQKADNDTLLLTACLAKDKSAQPTAIVILCINSKKLAQQLESNLLLGPEYSFAFIYRQDPLLVIGKNESLDTDFVSSIWHYHETHPQTTIFEFDSHVIQYLPATLPESILVTVTTNSIYYNTLYQTLTLFCCGMVLCVLAGLALTIYFTRINYKPVNQLMHLFKDTANPLPNNELVFIEKKMKQKMSELERYRKSNQNTYLKNLLTGEISSLEISDQAPVMLSSSQSCVITIQTTCNTGTLNNISMVFFALENVLGELLMPLFPNHYFCSFSQNRLVVLVSVPSEDTNYLKEIKTVIISILNFFTENFHLELLVGISNINNNTAIADSWLESNVALEYLHLYGHKSFMAYADIPKESNVYRIPLETSDYLQDLLLSGNKAKLDDYFGKLFSVLKEQTFSIEDIKVCLYFFLRTSAQLYRYCQAQHHFTPKSLIALTSPPILTQPILSELENIYNSYSAFMDELAAYSANKKSDNLGTGICRYIEHNYFDANLNLTTIAEHFSLTPSYLSKRFKAIYGKSVVDYLYEIRIINAKRLLTESNLHIAEIAKLVGFVDSNAFIRIFKKCEGITPGKYASLHNSAPLAEANVVQQDE